MKKIELLATTVVGSLPLANTKENMAKGFEDLIKIGIDYPCYPQLVSMIQQFLDPLTEIIDQLMFEDEKYYLKLKGSFGEKKRYEIATKELHNMVLAVKEFI